MGFENNPSIVAVKDVLRGIFLNILKTVGDSFVAFYNWLREVPIPAPPTMLKLFSNNKANLILFFSIVIYMLYINIRAYVLFAMDKHYAERGTERIPEKTLFKNMWLGGASGAALGMIFKRHKTQHKSFVITAIVLVTAQMLLFSFTIGFLGFWTFL